MAIEPPGQGEISENTSLLGHNHDRRGKTQSFVHKTWLLFLICLVAITIDFGSYLSLAPQIQIFESIICHDLHPDLAQTGSSNQMDARCKAPDVQGELALLTGWRETFDQLPGIILALPYGFMADRIGRKKVLLLSMSGMILEEIFIRIICWCTGSVPLRSIWITSLFQICGGGSSVATSMALTMITDVFPIEQRANILFLFSAAILLSEIMATPLSAWLMSWTPWLPFLLGLLCEVCGLFAAITLPETMPKTVDNVEDPIEDEEEESITGVPPSVFDRLKAFSCHAWRQVVYLGKFIFANPNVIVVSIAFFGESVGKQSLQLMIQYTSKRFSWTIAEASFLISLKGVINIVVLLILLPLVSQFLGKRFSAVVRDLRISQGSAAILLIGCSIMALATHSSVFVLGVSILALGSGSYAALRSVATALVAESHLGLLNSTVGMFSGLGLMVAGPLLAEAFRYGMYFSGVWIGLPYMIGSVLLLLATWATFYIRISPIES